MLGLLSAVTTTPRPETLDSGTTVSQAVYNRIRRTTSLAIAPGANAVLSLFYRR